LARSKQGQGLGLSDWSLVTSLWLLGEDGERSSASPQLEDETKIQNPKSNGFRVALTREGTRNSSPCRLAVLVSGGGTTMQALIDAIESGYLNAEISMCISSRRDVKAPDRARKHNIPVAIIRPRDFLDAAAYDEALCTQLLEVKPDLIILAGYLSILGPKTMASFAGQIMNIHPSLLPAFGGKGCYGQLVHEKVLDYGCKVSGVTVMFVDDQVDTGPIILQQVVDVLDSDTVETLTQKISQVEKKLYPLAIKLYAEGRLRIEGRRVKVIEGGSGDETSAY